MAPGTRDAASVADRRLRAARLVARILDEAFVIPGTSIRIGVDPIVGLLPGVGDAATAIASLYVVLVARGLGAPASLLARLVLNVGIDALVGSIPLLGDAFDVHFKANVRNVRLLERWMERPGETGRASAVVVALLLVALLVTLASVAFATWTVLTWVVHGRAGVH